MPIYTVKFPLDVVSKRETFDVIDQSNIEEVVRFNIKSTILTCAGERRSDVMFGCCARKYLFDFPSSYQKLKTEIVNQIGKYVPYCNIQNITIRSPEENPNSIHIKIRYLISEINKKDVFELILER
jgi:phage baseplate assembly protein W